MDGSKAMMKKDNARVFMKQGTLLFMLICRSVGDQLCK